MADNKLGKREKVQRSDGLFNVWEYMIDPTVSPEDAARCKKIDWQPSRWVVVDVVDR